MLSVGGGGVVLHSINSPFPTHTHTTQIKIQHDKVSVCGPQGMDTQIFNKTKKSCVIVDFVVV